MTLHTPGVGDAKHRLLRTRTRRIATCAVGAALTLAGAGEVSAAEASTAYRDTVQDDVGLVSHWRLNEATSRIAVDANGRNDGSYKNGTRLGVPGLLSTDTDTAAQYDGVDDYLSVDDAVSLDFSSAFTLEAWIKPRTLGPNATIMRKDFAYFLKGEGSNLRVTLWDRVGRTRNLVAPGVLSAGRVQHVVATFGADTLRLYVNGKLVGSLGVPAGTTVTTTATPLTIGRYGYEPFAGVIDEPAVYKAALTAAQVADHYVQGSGIAQSAPAPAPTPSPTPVPPPAPGTGGAAGVLSRLFNADAESGAVLPPYDMVETQGGTSTSMLSTVQSVSRTGGRAYKLSMPDPSASARVQAYTDTAKARTCDDYWYGISFRLGDDWKTTSSQWGSGWGIFLSWRWQVGSASMNGPMSLAASNVRGTPEFSWGRTSQDYTWPDGQAEDRIFMGPPTKGTWIDMVFHVKWSNDLSKCAGLREAWRDGVFMGRSTLRNMRVDNPVRWKAGLYEGAMIDHSRTLYWDNQRIGRSYAEVDPSQ